MKAQLNLNTITKKILNYLRSFKKYIRTKMVEIFSFTTTYMLYVCRDVEPISFCTPSGQTYGKLLVLIVIIPEAF